MSFCTSPSGSSHQRHRGRCCGYELKMMAQPRLPSYASINGSTDQWWPCTLLVIDAYAQWTDEDDDVDVDDDDDDP